MPGGEQGRARGLAQGYGRGRGGRGPTTAAGRGFSLIELMIVVAVIAMLAAAAVPIYADYLDTTRMTRVREHYGAARRFVEWKLRSRRDRQSPDLADPLPADARAWIAELDPDGVSAPGGGPAYVPGSADSATGAIGVRVTGTDAAGDLAVTLLRPAYSELTATRRVLRADAY